MVTREEDDAVWSSVGLEGLHHFIPLSEVEEQPDAHCESAILESDTESCE